MLSSMKAKTMCFFVVLSPALRTVLAHKYLVKEWHIMEYVFANTCMYTAIYI